MPDRFDLIRDGMTIQEARRIVRQRNAGTDRPPGWFELLGEVADTLDKAARQLGKAEEAIPRKPNERSASGPVTTQLAEDLAERLRKIETWE